MDTPVSVNKVAPGAPVKKVLQRAPRIDVRPRSLLAALEAVSPKAPPPTPASH